jgi:hypothetical protein
MQSPQHIRAMRTDFPIGPASRRVHFALVDEIEKGKLHQTSNLLRSRTGFSKRLPATRKWISGSGFPEV